MPIFEPPTVDDLPWILPETRGIQYLLFRHFGAKRRGRSLVKIGGVWTVVDTPYAANLEGLKEGVDYFIGGHVYVITDAVAADLAAGGYLAQTTQWNELTGVWGSYSGYTWETVR